MTGFVAERTGRQRYSQIILIHKGISKTDSIELQSRTEGQPHRKRREEKKKAARALTLFSAGATADEQRRMDAPPPLPPAKTPRLIGSARRLRHRRIIL